MMIVAGMAVRMLSVPADKQKPAAAIVRGSGQGKVGRLHKEGFLQQGEADNEEDDHQGQQDHRQDDVLDSRNFLFR